MQLRVNVTIKQRITKRFFLDQANLKEKIDETTKSLGIKVVSCSISLYFLVPRISLI